MKNFKFLSLYSIVYILVGIIGVNNIYIPIDGYFSLWLAGGFGFIMLVRYGKTALPYLWLSHVILQYLQFSVYYHQPVGVTISVTIALSSGIKLLQSVLAWIIWKKTEDNKRGKLFTHGFDVFRFLIYIALIPAILTSSLYVLLHQLFLGDFVAGVFWLNAFRITSADALGLFLLGPLIYSLSALKSYNVKDLLILFGSYVIPFVTAKAIGNNYIFVIVTPAAIIAAYYIDIKKLIPFHLLVLVLIMWMSTHQMTVFSNEMADKGLTLFMIFAFVASITMFYTSISFTELKMHKANLQTIIAERTSELEKEIDIRRKTEIELINKDRLVNTILSSSPIGITLIKNRKVVWVNDATANMLGYNAVEIIFNSVFRFYAGREYYDQVGKELYPKLLKDGFGTMESKFQTKSGEVLDVLLQAVPLNKEDLAEGLIFAIVDITALKNTEKELKDRSLRLEETNRELDAFAHSVAHDLKNPLNAVMGFSDLLINESEWFDEGEKLEYLKRINMQSDQMLQIIDTLLLLSGVRKEKVNYEYCSMEDVVKRSVYSLEEMIKAANAKVTVPANMPELFTHAPWLQVVWVNLISNAIKYGGHPPVVTIGCEENSTGFHFWVEDNGQGIPKEKLDKLFKEYVRVKYDKLGHGLGLSIVKRIVKRLSGEVFIESETGKGSRVGFKIPKVNAGVNRIAV